MDGLKTIGFFQEVLLHPLYIITGVFFVNNRVGLLSHILHRREHISFLICVFSSNAASYSYVSI